MKLTKEEQEKLLQEAKEKYIPGIEAVSILFLTNFIIPNNPEFTINKFGDVYIKNNPSQPIIYENGQWAEIIPSEPEKEITPTLNEVEAFVKNWMEGYESGTFVKDENGLYSYTARHSTINLKFFFEDLLQDYIDSK